MSENSSPPAPSSLDARRPSNAATRLVIAIGMILLGANAWMTYRLLERESITSREQSFWILCQPGHTLAQREEAFRRLVGAGNNEWRSAALGDLNLAGISIPDADLRNAWFTAANFSKANLSRARLFKGSLERSDLTRANLADGDFTETQFFRTAAREASFRKSKLRAAFLQEIAAEGADFMLADLSEADLLMANLTGANLSGADFSGARLEAAILREANFTLTQLAGANLKEVDLTNSNWWRARGLTSAQIEAFRRKFAPDEKAPDKLKEDFRKWSARGDE